MKPVSLILDLLRTYPDKGTSVRNIMASGSMFGFSENLMRVSLTRLVAKNTIENFQRGYYRLSRASDPVNDLVEQWRSGEARLKPWKPDTWLCVHASTGDSLLPHAVWALTNYGFRPVVDQLWIRPDNLRLESAQLSASLQSIGLPTTAVLLTGAGVPKVHGSAWFRAFDVAALNQGYIDMTQDLMSSMARLSALPASAAKKQSFQLGGRAIQLLVKDPLIPEQFQSPANRELLWKVMLEYDEAGRKVWSDSAMAAPDEIPTQRIEAI